METTIDNRNNEQPKSKGNIVLRGLSKIQKDTLLKTEIGLAGIAIGAGAFALMGFISKSNNKIVKPTDPTPDSNDNEVSDDAVVICTEAPFAKSVTDAMDFENAYATAREEVGPGGFFEYQGKLYNTYTKEEWNSMTVEQHQEYWQSIDEETTQIQEVDSSVTIPMNSPIDEPEPGGNEPEPVKYEIIDELDHDFEQKIIKELDSNNDGKPDIFLVDANGNEIHDLVLDTNFDGDADIILMDVNVVGNEIQFGAAYTMTGEVLPIGGPISIGQGADDEDYEGKDDQNEDDQEDTEADELDENDLQGNLNDEADNNISNDDSIDGFYS
ncbi:hypothetical protein [Flavobacterium sp.]|uniref:hypothetical protein n=1 Tax=Flavobacterium sp. TaxID=239 RepID=UPI003B9B1AEB